jgi:hypothetical protein
MNHATPNTSEIPATPVQPKTFEEVYETLPGDGWLFKSEAELLWNAANATQGDILEVGCYKGRSTVLLASLGRLVHCVDPFDGFDSDLSGDDIIKIFWQNITSRGLDKNIIIYRNKVEIWTNRSIGFAYLDGDHTYEGTIRQINKAVMCGAQSFCIHDYATSGGGREVLRALEYYRIAPVQIVNRMAHCVL